MKHVIEALTLPFIQGDVVRRPQSHSVMTSWRLVQVKALTGERIRYLVGQADGEGPVCAPVKELKVHAFEAVTPTGRRYLLQGPPGYDFDADYALVYWMRLNGIHSSREMSRSLLRLKARPAKKALRDFVAQIDADLFGEKSNQGART